MKLFLQCLSVLLFCAAAVAAEPERLFDGESLKGWEGDEKTFRVEDGAIVGGSLDAPIPRNEFLATTREFGDFDLRLKFKIKGEGANAGVQLRSKRVPDHHEMIGYQADLGEGWWGSLYDESRRNKILAKADEEVVREALQPDNWNDYRILCEGKRIRLWINDRQTVDYTEEDDEIEQSGFIALQIHGGPPSEAWYKDIEITELSGK